MGKHSEMTRYAFISHMEDYIRKLLRDPLTADTDDFLKSYNILPTNALSMLLDPTDENDNESSVLFRYEHIKNGGTDEEGNKKPDIFKVTYKLPRKDYLKKMRKLYKKLYENSNIVTPNLLNEEGEGGVASAGDTGQNAGIEQATIQSTGEQDNNYQYDVPFGIVRRKIYVTKEQFEKIKQTIQEEAENDTAFGDFGYDAPMSKGEENDDFYKEAKNHNNIMKNGWTGTMEEEIKIKKKNKGKFNATKKRTGKSTEELTHSKNPITRKRAIFSQNAAKWNKKGHKK